jgi:3-isopropylmalate/(R)-2-methylmalate dehydratase small subunit
VTLPDGRRASFPIDAFSKTCLLEGIDQLGYLLKQTPAIIVFEEATERV